MQQQIAEARQAGAAAAFAGAPVAEGTPMLSADVMHAAGEQAFRAGNIDAAIDAWLAESRDLRCFFPTGRRAGRFAPRPVGGAGLAAHPSRAGTALHFRRGWVSQGVERALLLDRLLELDPDPQIHSDLRALAAEHAGADERLGAIANRPG